MAKLPDLSELSLEELNDLILEATRFRAEKVSTRRAELMAELESLGGVPEKASRSRSPRSSETAPRAKPPALYRAPDGQEWTGRGAIPRFFKEMGVTDKEGLQKYRIKE